MLGLLESAICIMFMLMFIFTSINAARLLEYKRVLNSSARSLSLSLETRGYLSKEEVSTEKTKLSALGYEDIIFYVNGVEYDPATGTDSDKANYGENVSIQIDATLTAESINLYSILGIWDRDYDFKAGYTSISKAKENI